MTVRIETLSDGVTLYCGDNLPAMQSLADDSVDSCVVDPPYGLGREPAADEILEMLRAWLDGGHYDTPSKSGFMGKKWDAFVPQPAVWKEVYRVLKPGGLVLSFFGTRTYDLGVLAMRIADFEVRDMVSWLYGSGFPKSLDVSKAIDKAAGAERRVVGEVVSRFKVDNAERDRLAYGDYNAGINADGYRTNPVTEAATDDARKWSGFGTALKPACEPIVLARKPLSESTVAANVLKWGTGALNIDACRVGLDGGTRGCDAGPSNGILGDGLNGARGVPGLGRWPANVIHDGSNEVVGAFPFTQSGDNRGFGGGARSGGFADVGSEAKSSREPVGQLYSDAGSAARFFYSAKADDDDRLGSKHPTVKPLDLMQYLVRLVTPSGGFVLDCFAGTGTTGEACIREKVHCILIEREEEYQEDIRRRIRLAMAGPQERKRAIAKQKHGDKPFEAGGLFA